MSPITAFDLNRFDAVLFDLDGVLTDTASLHAKAWKAMFDEFLRRYGEEHGLPFVPFEIATDYYTFVDGKPRHEGVASFLESRRIVLPEGAPDDPPEADTIYGLGNRKNELVQRMLDREGCDPYPGSVRFVRLVRQAGLKTAVVSSSRNAEAVLEAAGIAELFDDRVDGEVADALELPGKPEPATYLAAAERLGVEPARAAVIEDALSGVEAGRGGGFGLVIGVDRGEQADALRQHGADLVVSDLADLLSDGDG